VADPIERLRCGLQLPDRSDETMDHPFPHVHMCIHPRGRCMLHEADRVVEQHFVVGHMDTDRREPGQIGVEGRRKRIGRILTRHHRKWDVLHRVRILLPVVAVLALTSALVA